MRSASRPCRGAGRPGAVPGALPGALAPSASAVKTLSAEAGMESETLQRFLVRNAGVAEGRLSRTGARDMRNAFSKTVLVVDEGSLASTVQARDLLRIAKTLHIQRVVLVGDEKQLDAVDAGKPFAQLQRAGMQTAVMDEILRQRDPALKEAVEASLAGDVRKAVEKLGSSVAEVKADNIAGAVAARWLRLSPEERENTGVMAPSHALRGAINGHIRERLAREGTIQGPAFQGERLVSHGYTRAEKALAANYAPGDVVAFHRPYKRLGVEKGDERRVVGVDHRSSTVMLEGRGGQTLPWKPGQVAGRNGGTEVYRAEAIELRAGDRVRWTRNDKGLGLVNSRTAEVVSAGQDRVSFRLEDGQALALGGNDLQLGHLDHAWASTVHAFQGRTVHNVIAADGGRPPAPDHAEEPLRGDQPGQGPGRTGDGRCGAAAGAARNGDRRADIGAGGDRFAAAGGTGKGRRRVGDTTVTTPERDKRPAPEAERDGADAVRRVREPAAPVREMAVELELEL